MSTVVLFSALPLSGNDITIYSHRHYPTDKELYKRFEEVHGIEVKVLQSNSNQLIERLRSEGESTPADLLITVDVSRLERAKSLGLLQPLKSATLEQAIPQELRDDGGYWYGLTLRARVIVYNKAMVSPSDLATYYDLGGSKWQDSLVMRSSSHPYNLFLLASIVEHRGANAANQWARGIANNLVRIPSGNDRDQMRVVAQGIATATIANSYYVGLMLNSDNARDRELANNMGVFYPNQNRQGAHVNISGAGVVKGSTKAQESRLLLEFLSSPEIQRLFATANYEIPVHPDLQEGIIDAKLDTQSLKQISEHIPEALRIIETTEWR